ncbi:MAG: hypothetical protein HUJ75_02300 [Parasporobacterium sp.]|nr:hypothetical protein [Parasporobacterium sp.]
MKKAFLTIFCICVAAIGVLLVINNISDTRYVAKSEAADYYNTQWSEALADYVNLKGLNISVDGKDQYSIVTAGAFMKDDMTLMISEDAVRAAFDCAIDVYDDERLVIARGSMNTEIFLEDIETVGVSAGLPEEQADTEEAEYAEEEPAEYRNDAIIRDGEIYISGDLLTESTGYSYKWDRRSMTAVFTDEKLPETALPEYFNGLDSGRVSSVKNQGNFGACWAFAALSAVESSLLPEEYADFSAEHMMYNSGFGLSPTDGGDYLMAMAYLSGWRGPVYEEDDPYGDEVSDPTLEAVKHVQEVQLIEDKDFDTIKHMVFKYGAVECSLYISEDEEGLLDEGYYSRYRKSYCYQGEDGPNHEIVIIGWDDNYPKEYFTIPVSEDGAFICKNSWGESFGAEGIFYVSYEDSVIGTSSEI